MYGALVGADLPCTPHNTGLGLTFNKFPMHSPARVLLGCVLLCDELRYVGALVGETLQFSEVKHGSQGEVIQVGNPGKNASGKTR